MADASELTPEELEGQRKLLEHLRDRLPGAMVARARDGAKDGDLVKKFDEAKGAARAVGNDGEGVIGHAIGAILTEQALEVRSVLMGELRRVEQAIAAGAKKASHP